MPNEVISEFERKIHAALMLFWSKNSLNQRNGFLILRPLLHSMLIKSRANLSHEQREDLIQITLIKISENPNTELRSSVAWLRTLVKRTVIDFYRSAQSKRYDNEHSLEDTSPSTYADDYIEELQLADCVEQVLNALQQQNAGPDDETILIGIVNGLSHTELAQQTGRNIGAITTRIAELRKKLKQLKEKLC